MCETLVSVTLLESARTRHNPKCCTDTGVPGYPSNETEDNAGPSVGVATSTEPNLERDTVNDRMPWTHKEMCSSGRKRMRPATFRSSETVERNIVLSTSCRPF